MKYAHTYRRKNERSSRIDLGLAILSALRKPNQTLTSHDIAAWCDCTGQAIRQIEARALRRLRNRLNDEDRQTFAALINERRAAAHSGRHIYA